jgi:hypothetical protein
LTLALRLPANHFNRANQYEAIMSSVPRGARRLIYRRGEFDSLPNAMRWMGPWTGSQVGRIIDLKPEIRLGLAKDGFYLLLGEPRARIEVEHPAPSAKPQRG